MRLLVLLTALVILLGGQAAAQSDGITIVTPITGDYATITIDEQLQILDTQTGVLEPAQGATQALRLSGVNWNEDGSKLLYDDRRYDLAWYNLPSQVVENLVLAIGDANYSPIEWSNNGNEILVMGSSLVTQYPLYDLSLYKYNLLSSTYETLFSYPANTTVTNIPNLQGGSPYNFGGIEGLSFNPTYNDWLVGNFYSQDNVANVILHNIVTGQMIQLNSLFPDQEITGNFRWNPDGTKLLLETSKYALGEYYLNIINFDDSGIVTLNSSIMHDEEYSVLVDWLGVSDIFIRSGYESSSPTTVIYSLNEIVDGTLYRQDFFHVNDSNFSLGDFYLRADDEEKRQLSCLFDQALPTQLEIGSRARVNFTDGTPLRLRDAPSFDANEITTATGGSAMPEGTEFDIIGGKACVNAESYYRFWQLELDNGTTGWAAEANLTEYFMEPVD